MTAKPHSSTVCTRLKIVRVQSHTFTQNVRISAQFPLFEVDAEASRTWSGCLIQVRRGHFLDTAGDKPDYRADAHRAECHAQIRAWTAIARREDSAS